MFGGGGRSSRTAGVGIWKVRFPSPSQNRALVLRQPRKQWELTRNRTLKMRIAGTKIRLPDKSRKTVSKTSKILYQKIPFLTEFEFYVGLSSSTSSRGGSLLLFYNIQGVVNTISILIWCSA